MKEIKNNFNIKIYYIVVWAIIAIILGGLFIDNPRLSNCGWGFIVQLIWAFSLSLCLLLYPKKETDTLRICIIGLASIYFYSLFLFYPDTGSNFILLCFIPALSILFFNSKLFYFTLYLNGGLILILFGYIMLTNQKPQYSYLEQDLIGNILNFIASQIIIYFIFYLTNGRMKKQQLYYEQIQQSERLKTSGQLAAAVAHEIRNPLTVVKGFLQLYEKDKSFSSDQKRNFTLMIDELNMAEQVITQFLTMAKPEQEQAAEIVDVKDVLQSVTDLLHSYGLLHDNRIELKVTGDCTISANIIELKQLLINIIKNAIEASNYGELVIVTAEKEKEFVVIKVIDHGKGMSEEELAALGTPFYSLKSKGTGLGLMICFNIVEKYNGKIDFVSSKNQGTTTSICFPYYDKQSYFR
ncbi:MULTISPECIES: sensor histidine kinase [Bacillaceae]|jgi:two-component system, sporulation sensor kinase B|uniref:sensor histidine kinase n=1 Tax=Bacillaceae TaxID=186817 RepID=UPI001F1D9FFA|nr:MULTISPECIES: HAMP domain-containing sensor histidine kinase [Bacillaceae]MCF2650733.1 HAMP domain-containing histidine kinase [Niallia circulans]MCM3362269.1 HAMP domain-containing histidine kinase [Niallia sp. MER TA 168]CAI9388304.1 Sensor histidine kinase RcsC [Bacillus sp. T2.9-1]